MSAQFIEPPDTYWYFDDDDDVPEEDPFEDADWQYEQEAESWD